VAGFNEHAPAPQRDAASRKPREGTTVQHMDTVHPTHDQVAEATAATEATMRPQSVPVNVYETPGALVVLAPLPAVTAKDVTIEVRPGTLRFWARLRSAGPRAYLVHEWDYGGYEREIDLPAGYGQGLEATLTNGQLAIRVLRGDNTAPLSMQPAPA
jgi:HSP20 family molecular chaperone IbpA